MYSPKCNFCGKTEDDVFKLVVGPGAYICDECVDLASEVIAEEREFAGERAARALLSPHDFETRLTEGAARATLPHP